MDGSQPWQIDNYVKVGLNLVEDNEALLTDPNACTLAGGLA